MSEVGGCRRAFNAELVFRKAAAFATADALLYGFIAANKGQDKLTVVGDLTRSMTCATLRRIL